MTEREFAEYPELTVEFMPKAHRYALIRDEERVSVPSVTSALKVLDKPALLGWSEKMGVEGALRLEREGWLRDIAIEDAIGVVRGQGQGADAKRDSGAERGTAIHEVLRTYCSEGIVPNVADFSPDVRGYVSATCKWLLAASPEPILTETMVGSWEHKYAGRFDLLATINGQRVLCDLKTSASVFAEHHMQIAAYCGALEECGIGPVDCGIIVSVGEDGEYRAPECCCQSDEFIRVLEAYRALSRVRSSMRAMEKAAA